jgi:hypothetical protein
MQILLIYCHHKISNTHLETVIQLVGSWHIIMKNKHVQFADISHVKVGPVLEAFTYLKHSSIAKHIITLT